MFGSVMSGSNKHRGLLMIRQGVELTHPDYERLCVIRARGLQQIT